MTANLKESGAQLLEIQDIDTQRRVLQDRIDALPQKRIVVALRAKQQEGSMRIAQIQARIAEEAQKSETASAALASLDAKIAAEQRKIDAATDHREVATLTRELENLARRKDSLESESLGHLQQLEDLELLRIDTEEKVASLSAREQTEIAAWREQTGRLHAELADLDAQRAQVAARLPEDLRARYEALAAEKGGVVVARFVNGRCLACSLTPPTARRAEIESSDTIEQCPQCRRLLVLED